MSPPRDLPRPLALLYVVYALTTFALLSVTVLLLILPVPRLALPTKVTRTALQNASSVAGLRLTVLHPEHMPAGPCIVVANHSSYLDGIVMCAALPPAFGFVIKREMSRVPLANLLLRRIGAHYVDRGQGQKGARDTRKLLKQANSGGALAFFPEGTFHHQPGLMRFRSGAFLIAARTNLSIVPVAIRGTRSALPPGSLWLRPCLIEIELAPSQPAPASTQESDVIVAREAARRAILERIPEPDLA